jgi:nucleoside-diphosphate-sugar epimerase
MGPFTVLGASGFIGSHLVSWLRQHGADVATPQRDATIGPEPLGAVVYCAGVTADFRARPLDTVESHVCSLRDLLAGHELESLTYLSSTRVYRRAQDTSEQTRLTVDPADPEDLYELSKLTGEALCRSAGPTRHHAVRLSNVYGPRRDRDDFVSALVDQAVTVGRVTVRSAPSSAKDYVSIHDVAPLLAAIAERGTKPTYNLARGRNTSHAEILEALAGATGCDVAFEPGAPSVAFTPIDVRRISDEFGAPTHDIVDDLPALVAARQGRSPG